MSGVDHPAITSFIQVADGSLRFIPLRCGQIASEPIDADNSASPQASRLILNLREVSKLSLEDSVMLHSTRATGTAISSAVFVSSHANTQGHEEGIELPDVNAV